MEPRPSFAWIGAKATLATELRGTQGLDKTDFGALVFTGENSYSGVTTVRDGTLQLGDGGTSGSIRAMWLLAAMPMAQARWPLTAAMNWCCGRDQRRRQGSAEGAGVSVFAGNNTYSGGLIVENGTAKAGIENNAFGSGPLRVLAGAAVDLASFGATVGGLAGAGNVLLGQGTLTLEQNSASIFWRHVGQGRSDQERIGSANACWRQQLCRCHRCQPWCSYPRSARALSAASAYWVDRGNVAAGRLRYRHGRVRPCRPGRIWR